jgi:hypothetical protein
MTVCAPAAVSVEVLRFEPQSRRTAALFEALTDAARKRGIEVSDSSTYRGQSDWLMLWGAGAPSRFGPMAEQIARGGRVLAWDLAYWDRYQKMRVSINGPHPQQWVMTKDWPADRFIADRVPVSNDWNPDGPVIIAGLGDKARVQYGADIIDAWEARMKAECQARGWAVTYRAKRDPLPIEQALKGASLALTWHSNVAVDAIRMGIPVVCQDGAAAAVCQSVLPPTGQVRPLSAALRDRFLSNLAWFQWNTGEAAQCWAWLRELLA